MLGGGNSISKDLEDGLYCFRFCFVVSVRNIVENKVE